MDWIIGKVVEWYMPALVLAVTTGMKMAALWLQSSLPRQSLPIIAGVIGAALGAWDGSPIDIAALPDWADGVLTALMLVGARESYNSTKSWYVEGGQPMKEPVWLRG